ncbi:hypothetical protein B1J97_02525 [Aeromonas veronii]|nr:hypothetical protein [Aeromonas veronii]
MTPSWLFPLMTILQHRMFRQVPSPLNLLNRKWRPARKALLQILQHCKNRFCRVLTRRKTLRLLLLVGHQRPVVVAVLVGLRGQVVMVVS